MRSLSRRSASRWRWCAKAVERTIVDPTPEEILRIRRECAGRGYFGGFRPKAETVVEIDLQRNIVRATASGATGFLPKPLAHGVLDEEGALAAAARLMRAPQSDVRVSKPHARTNCLWLAAYCASSIERASGGWIVRDGSVQTTAAARAAIDLRGRHRRRDCFR